jgi:hypothetical protein
MGEKERLEREALTYFLRIYNKKRGRNYRCFERRERPDFTIRDKDGGTIIGVEISHIFHDKKEAMMILGRDPSNFHGIITTGDHGKVISYVLKKKSEKVKYYPFNGPVILVLRDFSSLFDASTIMKHTTGIKVPQSGYKEVWYLTRSNPERKWDELIRLK